MRKVITILFTIVLIILIIFTALILTDPRIIQDENDWTDSSWTYYLGF